MMEAKRYCERITPHPLFPAQRNQQPCLFTHCVKSPKPSHLDLDTFKYYVCLCNELELVWTGGTNLFLVPVSFYLEVLQEAHCVKELITGSGLLRIPVLVNINFVPVMSFKFFVFASANSSNHPSKGVRPHNTRQIISAAYSLYSAAVSHDCSDKHLLVSRPIYVSTLCREEYYCASNIEVTLCVPTHTYQ